MKFSLLNMISISSSIAQINPQELFTDGFELQNQSVIPKEQFSGSFTQGLNNIEFYVYDEEILADDNNI